MKNGFQLHLIHLLFSACILFCYYSLPFKHATLLLFSLVFYAYGEVIFTYVMLLSILLNYAFGLWIAGQDGRGRKLALGTGVAVNLGILGYFKYLGFFYEMVAAVAPGLISGPPQVHLPLGISFFTFHALSYLIDVYRRQVPVERSLIYVAVYITMFPQLVAGPIIRFHDIRDEIHNRRVNAGLFAEGIQIFVIGLAQKVLIANTVAVAADQIFALDPTGLSLPVAWLGIVCYTLQIFFDFCGYSTMAIGLALMIGFHFPQNFNYPYISQSITEFWRRWHISLSMWFRDYLYIPLGGNRAGALTTCRNLLVVFLLCGLWHDAAWTFVVWGLWHGAFLVFDVHSSGVLVTEGADAGIDEVVLMQDSISGYFNYTMPANVERLRVVVDAIGSVPTLTITGSAGDDWIGAGRTNTPIHILGGDGNDTLNGGYGRGGGAIVEGGAGNDYLLAAATTSARVWFSLQSGDDTLIGGDGDDTLVAWSGNDRLTGGAGADTILVDLGSAPNLLWQDPNAWTATPGPDDVYSSISWNGAGVTTVTDFQPGIDVLSFRHTSLSLSDVMARFNDRADGQGVQASFTTTELGLQLPAHVNNTFTLSLDGLSRSQVSASWFAVSST